MARPSTGALTVYETLRIELSYLLKKGFLKKGHIISSPMSWTNQHGRETGSVWIRTSYLGELMEDNFIELTYSLTRPSGERLERKYKVYLWEQPSNLGKGSVLYFLCPQSGRRCRILYSAYGSEYFKAREAYRHRLYYDCQMASKLSRYNDNYFGIEKHLKALRDVSNYGGRKYKGKYTKASLRYRRLSLKQAKMDNLRWTLGMPKSLRGMF